MTGIMTLAATTPAHLNGLAGFPSVRGELPFRPDGSPSNWGKKKATQGEAVERQRVLVVDDEAIIADTVVEILNRSGYDAIARYSGRAALESIEEHCPSIVLSDVVMPGLNGIQLAQSVRKRCPSTRIVLFSGNAATARLLQDSSGTKHPFELLAKPIHPLELLKVLRS
jgi:CheY-like chemotaxis protein